MEEHIGTEAPEGKGWVSAGPMRWTRGEEDGPNVAIVGGGPGGLFAAYILNQRMPDANITIFEGSDHCGGKICTDEFSDGTQFEAGVAELYEYLGSGDKDPLRMLIEDDLELETVDIAGGAVILREQVLHDLDEVEKVHGRDTRKRIEMFHAKVAELMPLEKYAHRWQPDNEHPWADKTFRECIEEELSGIEGIDDVARDYIETAVASDLATESHTCNGLNGIKNVLMDNDKYMQVYHVVGGIGKIPEALLTKIKAKVKTSTRVTGVYKAGPFDPNQPRNESGEWTKSNGDSTNGERRRRYSVSTLEIGERTLKERTTDFDAVIVALPNHWLRTIQWEGKLAQVIHEICAHYDLPAHYLRVSILFDKKWWADLKMPGEFWMMDMMNGCCCYDESTRWGEVEGKDEPGVSITGGHVLSFLLAGGDALLLCSSNQDDECIIDYLMQSLPVLMRQDAEDHFVEAQVDRYVGSINAQPGGWPAEELRGEHTPEPSEHPGVFLVCDAFFDSTVNAALMSANIAIELLVEHFGKKSGKVTKAIEALETNEVGV